MADAELVFENTLLNESIPISHFDITSKPNWFSFDFKQYTKLLLVTYKIIIVSEYKLIVSHHKIRVEHSTYYFLFLLRREIRIC